MSLIPGAIFSAGSSLVKPLAFAVSTASRSVSCNLRMSCVVGFSPSLRDVSINLAKRRPNSISVVWISPCDQISIHRFSCLEGKLAASCKKQANKRQEK